MAMPGDRQVEVMPPGFGLLRIQESGTSTHELIYEQDYFPQPVRPYSADEPVVDSRIMRPAIRNGKVDFKFYGNRVPLTADHARCWLGHLLLQEVHRGLLGHVELIVQRYEDFLQLQSLESGDPQKHGVPPTWRWEVWIPTASDDRGKGPNSDPRSHCAVGVVMSISSTSGITIELESSQEALAERAAVIRVLRQYCDEDPGGNAHWHPIPEAPGIVTKIVDRSCTDEVKRKRMLGLKLPETGLQTLHRSLNDWKQAETRLLQAIAQAQFAVAACEQEASKDDSGLRALLQYCGEVRDALDYAAQVSFKVRVEWSSSMTAVLEALLNLTSVRKDADLLRGGIAMVKSICDLGVGLPSNLDHAEKQAI